MPLFLLRIPTPFPIPVRILGKGIGFPKVVLTPGPGGPIPIPIRRFGCNFAFPTANGRPR